MVAAPILLTGFEPFGDIPVNASALLMERLAGTDGVVTAVLPAEYTASVVLFAELLERCQPMAAVAFGMKVRSDFLVVERLAWNRDESEQPDNAGVVRADVPIVEDGPTAYGSGVPIPMLLQSLARAGFPVTFSDHAGGFVCNHLFYSGRHLIETCGLDIPMAFLHVPPLPEQVADQSGRRGLALDRQELAARTVVGMLQRALSV